MAVKQLTVFVENQPGMLKGIVSAIAGAGVNIRAMSIADTADYGILRLIVSDLDKAKAALSDYVVSAVDVVAVKMSDKAGSLADILGIFDKAGVNIEYMYAFTSHAADGAYVVLRVNDNDAAEKVLSDSGVVTLSGDDIKAL